VCRSLKRKRRNLPRSRTLVLRVSGWIIGRRPFFTVAWGVDHPTAISHLPSVGAGPLAWRRSRHFDKAATQSDRSGRPLLNFFPTPNSRQRFSSVAKK